MLVSKDTILSLRCTVVSLGFFLLVSLYLRGGPGDELQERLLTVVRGLIEVEDRHVALSPRVAVGYGACVDLLVQGSSFLPYDPVADSPRHFEHINTYEELYRSFAYYFKHGAATE
jgi:ADP-dependent glucokinase